MEIEYQEQSLWAKKVKIFYDNVGVWVMYVARVVDNKVFVSTII